MNQPSSRDATLTTSAAGDPAFIRSGVVVQGGVFQSPLTKSEPPPDARGASAIPPQLYRFFLTYRARKRARRSAYAGTDFHYRLRYDPRLTSRIHAPSRRPTHLQNILYVRGILYVDRPQIGSLQQRISNVYSAECRSSIVCAFAGRSNELAIR